MYYFLLNIGPRLINFASVFNTLSVNFFENNLQKIYKRTYKNLSAKREEIFVCYKNVPPNKIPVS